MKEKCDRQKRMSMEEYKGKTAEMDEREKELCQKTNKLVDELVDTCGDTPFHKALIELLRNLKGNRSIKSINN